MGDKKGGAFDIPKSVALEMLSAPTNPNGQPNSEVVRRWANGLDITRRPRDLWIIDFGDEKSEMEAAQYTVPFEYVSRVVKSGLEKSNTLRRRWWLHERPRPEMRNAMQGLPRYIGTARVAKYRLFVFLDSKILPDSQIIFIARNDDYFLGILHSKLHKLWALRLGTSLEDRPRYTPTTTFETFPFPWPPGKEDQTNPRVQATAEAARELVCLRDEWLNPPGLPEAELKQRTLTNLYNKRPDWLGQAHKRLDAAVFDAYGWPHDLSDDEILARLLALNLERSAGQGVVAVVEVDEGGDEE
jgi:type II restriction/modification system DNA methylase subunit YeeA